MGTPETLPASRTLSQARRRVVAWRRTRAQRRTPMPEALWTTAVTLARAHGRARTARALGLNYTALRTRLEAAAPRRTAAPLAPTFVELPALVGVGPRECVIEYPAARGPIRLRLAAEPVATVVALVDALGRSAP